MTYQPEVSHVNNYLEILKTFLESVNELVKEFMKIEETKRISTKNQSRNIFFGHNLYFASDCYKKLELTKTLFILYQMFYKLVGKIQLDYFTNEELFDFLGYGEGYLGGIRCLIFSSKNHSYPEEYNEYFIKPLEILVKEAEEKMKEKGLTEEDLKQHWGVKFGWAQK